MRTGLKKMLLATVAATSLSAGVAMADIPPSPAPQVEADHGSTNHGAAGDHGAAAGHGGHHDPSQSFNWFNGIPFGYKSMDVKGGPMGDGKLGTGPDAPSVAPADEEGMPAPFILMFVNFGLLLIILAKFAGPAARKAAESRSDQIKNALEESAKLRKEAADKLEEYKTKLADADAQISKMVSDMKASAETDKQRMLANAAAQAAAMQRDAESRIAAEITRARTELTREVSIAAAAAAEKMLREKANGGDHTKLVDTFIADLMQVPADSKEKRV